MKKGTELELEIEKFGDRGKSIARADGFVVLVQGGVPGDRVRARIVRKKRKYAEAALLEVIEPGRARVEPRCAHFGDCGGCKLQHVAYAQQLVAKQESVVDAFRQVAGLRDAPVGEIVGASREYAYRNKMEFSFSASRWLTAGEIASGQELDRSFALGLHVPGNFEKVLDIRECHLVEPWVGDFINEVRGLSRSMGWTAWDVREHHGYLRHLVVRDSSGFPEALVNLVVSRRDDEAEATFAAFLRDRFPRVSTFAVTQTSAVSQTSYGETETIFGSGYIRDRIGEFVFRITPGSFFQTNTKQAARLYALVVEMADFRSTDTVYDLYCGAGTISLFVSPHVARVVGVEVVAEAVEAARENASDNAVANALFEVGDILHSFDEPLLERHGSPDVVIVDPPRAGLHPKVVSRIASLGPSRVVYVSCNPRTMSRDIGLLAESYRLDVVRPLDMFPQTHHTEAVARLTRIT